MPEINLRAGISSDFSLGCNTDLPTSERGGFRGLFPTACWSRSCLCWLTSPSTQLQRREKDAFPPLHPFFHLYPFFHSHWGFSLLGSLVQVWYLQLPMNLIPRRELEKNTTHTCDAKHMEANRKKSWWRTQPLQFALWTCRFPCSILF